MEDDIATMARVCLLGATVHRDLFGESNPLGEYIQIGNVRFLIKSLLEIKETSPDGRDMDNRVYIPFTTGLS